MVLCHQGKFGEAIEIASRYLEDDAPLGPTAELLGSLLVECKWLVGDPLTDSAPPSRHSLNPTPIPAWHQ